MTTMMRRLTLGLRTSADGSQPRKSGRLLGLVLFISDDFDEPLDDFADYM